MSRLTREKDEYRCRIKECCMEEWVEELTGVTSYNWETSSEFMCDNYPLEKYVNKLAEYEDEFDKREKFRKNL